MRLVELAWLRPEKSGFLVCLLCVIIGPFLVVGMSIIHGL